MNPAALFLDIGGVLLTNGWDRHARRGAAKHVKLEWAEIEKRRAQFRPFMCAQSKPYPEMIELVIQLKARCHTNIAAVSYEARIPLSLPASSTSASLTLTSFGLRWISPRCRPGR